MPFYSDPENLDYRTDYIFRDIQYVKADRKPCPICGHPTGDCINEDNPPETSERVAMANAAPSNKNMMRVPEDVIQEVRLTPTTVTKKIVARAGTYISIEKAKEIGIL